MCTKSFVLNTKLLHGHFFVVVKIYTFRLVFQPRCFSKYVWLEFPSYDYSLLPSIDLFCNVHVLMAASWIHMHYYFWTNVLSIFTWILASERSRNKFINMEMDIPESYLFLHVVVHFSLTIQWHVLCHNCSNLRIHIRLHMISTQSTSKYIVCCIK